MLGINKIDTESQSAKSEIEKAEAKIKTGKEEIKKGEGKLEESKKTTKNEINKGKQEIKKAREEIKKGEEELNSKKEEFDSKIRDAENKLIDAREEVRKIENPKWYILDRNQNAGYAGFIQDTKSVDNLSLVFPIVFFAIATLVSLTSMTRMVEENRQELGTLKALGYNKFQIMFKYIMYSSLASIIGGTLGIAIGIQLLPRIILKMYRLMYTLPATVISPNSDSSLLGLTLIFICIVGATIYAVVKDLSEKPANLLRPKAPKMGKRVFLERITPIWKHLNFSNKVTVRNIFRYKKRVLMTIIGILGCTALILTGFGIKDSISAILPNQFENIFTYDFQITMKESLEESKKEEIFNKLKEADGINNVVKTYMTSGTVINDKKREEVQIVVPENEEELKNVIKLKDIKSTDEVKLKDDEIMLTDKLAELIGAKTGDTIKLDGIEGKTKEIKISNIIENYISHYVYMSKELYNSLYGDNYSTNVLFVRDNDFSKEQEEEIAKKLLESGKISGVTLNAQTIVSVDDMLGSLNYVVIILIVSAGLLAFVVLYNLANVNISERVREIATIKVLGFYDKEVYDYIARESTILTCIGIILGLVGGYFLNYYIIGTCEIDMLRFAKVINPLSYLYAILITIAFTIIVNLITYFALKKIDMISSLKSVE